MLSNNELRDLFVRIGTTPAAQQLIENVRTSQPSRRTQSSAKSVSSRYPSKKMGCVIQAESHTNELAAIYDWDHDDSTFEFYDQPPQIQIPYPRKDGRVIQQNVTPDYFVLRKAFIGWVECKTDAWLESHVKDGGQLYSRDETGVWRCKAGESYAAKFGLGFEVRPSSQNDWLLIRNLKFLSDYLDEKCPEPDLTIANSYLEPLRATAWILLMDLLRERTAAENGVLYKLIADESVFVDLACELLCEPYTTRVYRDRNVAAAHKISTQTRTDQQASFVRVLNLRSGDTVTWDKKVWRIVNAGEKEIALQSAEQELISLNRADFEGMVAKQLIEGVAEEMNTQSDFEMDVLSRASSADLSDAQFRFEILQGTAPENVSVSCTIGGIPRRAVKAKTISRWQKRFNVANSLHGNGFLGLITHRAQKGNRNCKLGASVSDLLGAAAETWKKDQDSTSKRGAWGKLVLACEEKGLIAPSEKAFRSAIKKLNRFEVARDQEGSRVAYALEEYQVMERTTPRHGDRSFEIAHIDHTQVDLQLIGRKYGEQLRKPWLTLLFDAYSRSVLAFSLSFDPPSYRSCLAVLRECVKTHSRMPDNIVSDSGSEFESIYYESLLARCGTTKKTRAKGKPRFGAVLERWFGVSNAQLIHALRGNNRRLQEPRTMVASHDPRKRAIWTLPDFRELFADYVADAYHAIEHPALGASPAEVMAEGNARAGARHTRVIHYTEAFKMMSLPSTRKGTAKVIPGRGVKIGYSYYNCPQFSEGRWQTCQVEVRYDPMDMSVGYVLLAGRWVPLRSEYFNDLAGHSEKEIQLITLEIRSRLGKSDARRRITARVIAEYMRGAHQSEAVLLQRKKDMEFMESVKGEAKAPSADTTTPPANNVKHFKSRTKVKPKPFTVPATEKLEIVLFGDFK